MAKVFWDSNLFIYLFEKHPELGPEVVALRRKMIVRGDRLMTSSFTVAEVLVKPIEVNRADLVSQYQAMFGSPALVVIPFDTRAAIHYASIRQDKTITRPDAIQLACAAAGQADLFVTNDRRLSGKIVEGIHFICGLANAPL